MLLQETGDVENKIDRKRREAVKRSIFLQLYILLVGSEDNILNSYVIYGNTKYKCDSVLAALDLAFKIFFVSNCEYPTLSNKIWLFIQRALYNIEIANEKLGTQLEAILHYFNTNCN